MHPSIKHVIALQALDLRLNELRRQLEAFPKRSAEVEGRTEAARKQFAAAREALTNSLKERKRYELDVEQWKEKARKYRDQSYEVKTNEAYKALQHEVQMAEAEIAKAEDQLLEQMISGEEHDRKIKASEKACREVEEAAKSERGAMEAEEARTKGEFARLEAERKTLAAQIPEELLDHYLRIAKRHGGVGVAEVRDGACSACGGRVRPQVFQELRRAGNDELFHCEICTRILYYEEPSVAPSEASASVSPTRES